ncbi:acetoacetate decarboxylase family protein [Streptomyces sp. NBC_00536]|uniref:acetoacetate decarboxylase family protein n=1 Tax=Streptomyces sp. NBC_00536 TaxID=2975769 RepID=UPI002E803EEF|nr:acetoacetate decarboxylase family protein [Streptomyces sp. NBC_00536]WUC77526.1 acetoacetate decarboxylase family protein [Streptomyces sp. NBC_00536]
MTLPQDEQQSLPSPPSFPPAPWRMSGRMWMGLFPVPRLPPVPGGLSVVLPRHLLVAAIRYLDGDLRYNEFVIASAVRSGFRVGAFIHHIWVDNAISQEGGRHIWGLDKQLANFQWTDQQVRITSDQGLRVTMAAHPGRRATLPLLMPLPAFAPRRGQLTYALAPVRLHAGPTQLSLTDWPAALPTLSRTTTRIALQSPRFRVAVPAPHPVNDR